MSSRVKICGITTAEALDAAVDAGADYVGFVFYPRSPRHIGLEQAARLARLARDRIETVALTVNATDREFAAVMDVVRPDLLQLHGEESVERIQAIKALTRTPVIKAVKVGRQEDISAAAALEAVADILLFDARAPSPDALPGGNGVAFEWGWLREGNLRENFMLSGGLNPDNVRTAISASGAAAVDVSSGVEFSPGAKSSELIRRFIAQAKASAPAQTIPERAV